ncbi:MEDS domain-containing protein [Nitrosomonas supralitoralis]|uniref:MEDS domain-containing protein n=1 Tax=Nitrosomonas supralitoralis TaxID=2116706 RepID=A0A2P7NSD9_9PROT|nr:MEDS domain-containing protein [Nitrosomonas supralitoralis]PSJ16382.1 hypothetical protein C7H79_13840 [Nitrosomonas supralitoralis]
MITLQDVLKKPDPFNHIVQVCEDVLSQSKILTHYIKDGLVNDEAIIVIAKPGLRQAVMFELDGLDLDLQRYKNSGQIKFFDAEFLLSNLLFNRIIDKQAFHDFVTYPIQVTRSKFGKVRAFGEMVDVLWQNNQEDSALQLEDLWNDLCMNEELMLLCTYLLDSLDPNDYEKSLEHICKCHTHSIPINTLNTSSGPAMLEIFGTAWNKVMSKLTESKTFSHQMPQPRT